MKLTPAEFLLTEMNWPSTEPTSKTAQAKLKFIRQIQANAIRWSAEHLKQRKGLLPSEYNELLYKSNQLDPIPETNEQSNKPKSFPRF